MIAPDTNVLVRLLVAGDAEQTARARSIFESEDALILKTVLLETEWVLRSRYGLERDYIAAFFQNLAETDGIAIAHDGTLYMTNFGIFPGGGEVLKISVAD